MIKNPLTWEEPFTALQKPSKYFCSLEHKRFLDKTIRKIHLDNGTIITEQGIILNQVKDYYADLFKSKDTELIDINLSETRKDSDVTKLTNTQAQSLEGAITLSEIGQALKCMKNNKTPGIDGFPAEFFKYFAVQYQ